jgi:dipeptidyl aminopeptidase/acylaminoacyl peptidase
VPPPKLFRKVDYPSPAGKLAAYLTPDPRDGKKHPAIIWITGGDCNSIGDSAWTPARPSNDQSARQYREAGMVMMFPSLRGGNTNPGVEEGFLGEVDDILAAADYLANQGYVDPKRIYLGGHSTGGTLVMLVAESTDRFRAVFSFGPASDVSNYDNEYTPFNRNDQREIELRSPVKWLHCIRCPTFVFEGTIQGNIQSLQELMRASTSPKAHFYPVNGASHFSILAPTNRLIAQKILRDEGPETNIAFTAAELNKPFGR